MKRPDLTSDGRFDGWQVLDPTPQEMSDGKTFSDPCSSSFYSLGGLDQDRT